MTPEMKLAKVLGHESNEQEKLAHAFESLSIEELEGILRNEKTAGEMEEKKEKDYCTCPSMRNTTCPIHGNKAREQKRAENLQKLREKTSSVIKTASMVEMADDWGRELAYRDFEKLSAPVGGVMAGALGTAKKWLGTLATRAQPMARGAAKALEGSTLANRAALGATAGGAAGLMRDPGVDPYTGRRRSRIGAAIGGATVGGLASAAAKPALGALRSSKSIQGYLG